MRIRQRLVKHYNNELVLQKVFIGSEDNIIRYKHYNNELVLQKVFIGSEDNIIRYEQVLRSRGESSIIIMS